MPKKLIIAIDGPAASGKSTTARLLAGKLDYVYLDTGAMYRACALQFLRNGVALSDLPAVEKVLAGIEIKIELSAGENRILLNGEDVTSLIRSTEISALASAVSALPPVRHKMVELQRIIAGKGGFVLDGRDIGTYVFPDADIKFFLVAEADERARRRLKELSARGVSTDFDTVLRDLLERDKNDQGRALAPLVAAQDAIRIDTTNLSIEQQVEVLFGHIKGMLSGV
jgi:cytidylate kinase